MPRMFFQERHMDVKCVVRSDAVLVLRLPFAGARIADAVVRMRRHLAAGTGGLGVHEQRDDKTVQTCEVLVMCIAEENVFGVPKTSAKMRIRIMPTNNLGCWAVPRTPASPTMPMAKPAAIPERPTERPAPSWMKLSKSEDSCFRPLEIRTDTTRP